MTPMIDTQQTTDSTSMPILNWDQEISSLIGEHGKEIILAKGDSLKLGPRNNYYFVAEGLQCLYVNDQPKKNLMDLVSAPYSSSILQDISDHEFNRYYLQCLTRSHFFEIPKSTFGELLDENRQFERFIRKLTEKKLAEISQRYYIIVTLSIEDRFKIFFKDNRQLLQKVPHKYLASYLNIHPTNFSKLLGKIRI